MEHAEVIIVLCNCISIMVGGGLGQIDQWEISADCNMWYGGGGDSAVVTSRPLCMMQEVAATTSRSATLKQSLQTSLGGFMTH